MLFQGTLMTPPAETEGANRCNQCGQELIEIDNRGEAPRWLSDVQSLDGRRRQGLDKARRG